MEYQKIKSTIKFRVEINDESHGVYKLNLKIVKLNLKSSLRDYSDTYIQFQTQQPLIIETKKLIFKNCAPLLIV